MNAPNNAWTPHLALVLCQWEKKLDELACIIGQNRKSEDDLKRLDAFGFNTWDEASDLLQEIHEVVPAPPYGFTAKAAENLEKWPIHARYAYQVVMETPVGDLPLSLVEFAHHLLHCRTVNKYHPRSAYTLGYNDDTYRKKGQAKIPRTEASTTRTDGAHVWDGFQIALPLEDGHTASQKGMPKMIEESVIMWDRWRHGDITQARDMFAHEKK